MPDNEMKGGNEKEKEKRKKGFEEIELKEQAKVSSEHELSSNFKQKYLLIRRFQS